MKPVLLKLSGLQSYRSPQEINFEALCEMGLFGIFGPTGSGKSTLLGCHHACHVRQGGACGQRHAGHHESFGGQLVCVLYV